MTPKGIPPFTKPIKSGIDEHEQKGKTTSQMKSSQMKSKTSKKIRKNKTKLRAIIFHKKNIGTHVNIYIK